MIKLRTKTTLSSDRWAKYAAASAAGLSTVLGVQTTIDADVTVVNVNMRLEGNGSFGPFPIKTGSASFRFFHQSNYYAGFSYGTLNVAALTGLTMAGFTRYTYDGGAWAYASNLPYGQFVSQADNFLEGWYGASMAGYGYIFGSAQFNSPGQGFLGFQFDVGNGTQYGYAEFSMDGGPFFTGTFVKYAWAEPGEPIFAGQVPEPNSLGVLALGSIGLLAWRRKRASKVQPETPLLNSTIKGKHR